MPSSIAVLSDIHGMLGALDRVLREPAIDRAELIVVTGDHTWGPQPTGVLDRLTGLGDRVVMIRGNADRELLRMSQGIDVGLAEDPLSVWGAAQLTPAHQQLLERMPERRTFDVDGFGPVLFCHATPRDDEEVVLVDSRMDRWDEVLREVDPDVRTVVCGHTHMPFVRLVDGRLVVNPGSVGLPYGRDGAHWAVLEAGAVTIGRTRMDADELIRETAASSAYPGVRAWLEDAIGRPASDRDALAAFGPRDGR
ncbi:phosphodiesterase [Clavibacter michiganensis]|uniref:Phosphodiesterase n=1 Tax=Clavibacter michiganensis TaxID=28447 RepID=A0A251Y908_9MICO|nr:metallophosphoesterase family protein [Clavibacter michiganensis]OUE20747.1 phosphodiesterase [Clavibacter michiganensis]